MAKCTFCGAPMIIDCINMHCSKGKESSTAHREELKTRTLENKKHSRKKKQQPRSKGDKSTTKSVKRPDLSKPIPDTVNSKEFIKNPKFSLLGYLGYSRAANQTDELRQASLSFIISAHPLTPSQFNSAYLRSFGDPNSSKRVKQIISLIAKFASSTKSMIKRNPSQSRSRGPSLEKAEKDISWLEDILEKYQDEIPSLQINFVNNSQTTNATTEEIDFQIKLVYKDEYKDKQYYLTVVSTRVEIQYGKTGGNMRTEVRDFNTKDEAQRYAWSKENEKRNKGYKDLTPPIIANSDENNSKLGYSKTGQIIKANIGKSVSIKYTNGTGYKSTRTIVPRKVYKKFGHEYVEAYCEDKDADRNFRLDRMTIVD
jgi:predicted DNA-binding WGR domain protein